MTKTARPSSAEHPLALGSLGSWMGLLRRSRRIGPAYVPRVVLVSLTTLLTSPLRLAETLRHGRAVRRTRIHPSPVFIIGHWRSGTTHLHNLMVQDEAFGALTTFQAMAPGFCLIGDGVIKRFIAGQAASRYGTRLIDNIPLALDAPQEDEYALATLSPHAFLHIFSLPRQAREIFSQDVMLDGQADPAGWLRTYRWLLRKTTLACGNRRLVIKNCAHSARIPLLLEAFPDAKFIHIHRNPYRVFQSTLHMHRTVLPRSQLQSIQPEDVEANVLRFYELLMRRFLVDRARIPAGNLVDVCFEDLESSPVDQLQRVYEGLRLPGFEEAKPRFRVYLDSIAGYKKNAYTLDAEVIDQVNRHWSFAFEPLGYPMQ